MVNDQDKGDLARVLLAFLKDTPKKPTDLHKLDDVVAQYMSTDLKTISLRLSMEKIELPMILEPDSRVMLGGSGIVFEATHAEIPELKYAVKIQRPSLFRDFIDPAEEERSDKEYIHHAPLSSINVARLFWTKTVEFLSTPSDRRPQTSPTPVMVLEWIDGATELNKYLAKNVVSSSHLVSTVIQCFSGLAHLHSKLLIHWDVKSDNLLVGADGVVKLMDIGNARRRASRDRIALTGC